MKVFKQVDGEEILPTHNRSAGLFNPVVPEKRNVNRQPCMKKNENFRIAEILYSHEPLNSTRRFMARPLSVLFDSRGLFSP